MGIDSLYQGDFLRAAPTFEFLLAGNGGANVVGVLEVHQALQEVFAGKTWRQPMLVLVYAAVEVVGDADVQSPRAIGHDIDVIGCQTLPPADTIASRRSLKAPG